MAEVDLSSVEGVTGTSRNLTGYVARPSGNGPWPGVVVVHELFGLDDVMRRQADHLASLGYLAVLPGLFSDGGARRCLVSTFRAMAKGSGRPFNDIEASRHWLLAQDDCSGKVGVIGFCMGGAFALLTAKRGFDVAAPNYGALPKDLQSAVTGACPVVASYGGKDVLRGSAAKLQRALTSAGVPNDVKEYPNAGHSFLNDAPAGPRWLQPVERVLKVGPEPASAADAWRRIDGFFREHLAA